MKLQGEYFFHGPQQEVWEMMRDPQVLARALPGTQKLDQLSDTEYEGKMNVRVGPVGGVFSGKVSVTNEVPPKSCTLLVEGKGGPGFAKGSGDVELFEQEDGNTLMKYVGEVHIGGRLASVGQRMVDSVSKSMIKQALEAMDRALQIRIAAKAEGMDLNEVDYDAQSEIQFAAAVAKDMVGSVFKKKDKDQKP
jgi:carbon monoxide dehydrogenase subunit G